MFFIYIWGWCVRSKRNQACSLLSWMKLFSLSEAKKFFMKTSNFGGVRCFLGAITQLPSGAFKTSSSRQLNWTRRSTSALWTLPDSEMNSQTKRAAPEGDAIHSLAIFPARSTDVKMKTVQKHTLFLITKKHPCYYKTWVMVSDLRESYQAPWLSQMLFWSE